MKRICCFSLLAGAWLLAASPAATAQSLWKSLVPGQRIEADPTRDYVLTEDNGPWLILATTFSGDGAPEQARELVLELRKRYKLEAYTHEMTFDFTRGVEGRGVDATGQPLRMRYQRGRQIREIAVLVGNYPTVDDPQGQTVLQKIKFMRPKAIDPHGLDRTYQSLAALRTIQAALLPNGDERKQRGPMGHAFMSRNPLVPKEYFVPTGLDPFIARMNSDVKWSLLECPGEYTVKVATFTGNVVLDQKKVQQYLQGKEMKGRLEQAGEDAELLCGSLRKKGYEAYVFHDRSASMVTVGAFTSVGVPRGDGKIEINPKIHTLMQTFSAAPADQLDGLPAAAAAQGAYVPKTQPVSGGRRLPFDIQATIVHVPKRTISSYAAGGNR